MNYDKRKLHYLWSLISNYVGKGVNKVKENLKLGLTGYYLDAGGVSVNNTVFGSKVAVTDLLRALFRYSRAEEIEFSYVDMYYQHIATKRIFNQLKRAGETSTTLKFINRIDMIQNNTKYEADIIHDLYSDFLHTALLREYYSMKKPPITYTIHCASAPSYTYGYYLINLFSGLKRYDSMICTSKAVKSAIENEIHLKLDTINRLYGTKMKYNGRLDLIPLGIDDHIFHPMDQMECRRALGLDEDAFIILYFGRVSAFDKGDLLPLIQVFHRLIVKNKAKKLKLIIAGTDYTDKPYYPALENNIKKYNMDEDVTIMKEFDYSKRAYLYAASDVFTSPIDSLQETFGLTPIEAMACGVPQIVSDWDGYKDTVRHGITGFRVPSYWMKCDDDISLFPYMVNQEFGHETVLSHLLLSQSVAIDLSLYEYYFQQMIDHPKLCKQMSENSRRIAQEEYSYKRKIRSYEELWSELIDIRNAEEDDHKNYMEIFHNRYCEAFSNYPTRFLHDSEYIQLSQDGIDVIEEKEDIPIRYDEEKVLYEGKIVKCILRLIPKSDGITIGNLLKQCDFNMNESVYRRSIMFLIKHGYVELRDKTLS